MTTITSKSCVTDAKKDTTSPQNHEISHVKLAYGPDEAADRIGLGRSYFYGLLRSGLIPAKKAGRRTLILHAHLEAFLAGLQNYGGQQ